MFKSLIAAFIVSVAAISASPVESPPAVFKSTKFSGSFEEAIVGRLARTSSAGTSLERRQDGSLNGDVLLCSGADCASGCIEVSTTGGGAFGVCEFTLPNPFFSFGLTNPPVGTFFPFTIGINQAPAACPQNLFHLTEANVCFNIPGGGNGWTFESGDISIMD